MGHKNPRAHSFQAVLWSFLSFFFRARAVCGSVHAFCRVIATTTRTSLRVSPPGRGCIPAIWFASGAVAVIDSGWRGPARQKSAGLKNSPQRPGSGCLARFRAGSFSPLFLQQQVENREDGGWKRPNRVFGPSHSGPIRTSPAGAQLPCQPGWCRLDSRADAAANLEEGLFQQVSTAVPPSSNYTTSAGQPREDGLGSG